MISNSIVVGYADDVIIISESEEDLKRTTIKLIEKGGKIGLMVNEEKTKYKISILLLKKHSNLINKFCDNL